jgi:cysteine desulfurase
MKANNETGVILDPNNSLYDLKKTHDFVLHVDACQAYGKISIDVSGPDSAIDMMSISGHKVHALKGVGALYIRKDCPIKPKIFFEGGHHERGLRPGTENQIGIHTLGQMARKIHKDKVYQILIKAMKSFRKRFEESLADISEVNGNKEYRLPNISNLYFPDLPKGSTTEFIEVLSQNGLSASAGAACNSGIEDKASHTLVAMYGADDDRCYKSARFSLSVNTGGEDIKEAARIIRETVQQLKEQS